MVAVIGSKGVMGRRYSAILTELQVGHMTYDVPFSDDGFKAVANAGNHIIVATPTDTHDAVIRQILAARAKPAFILCEKPITKNIEELSSLYDAVSAHGSMLYCVNQYAYLPGTKSQQKYRSTYNYFNTGKDGLHWDCFQIYALARGEVQVLDRSPVWACQINGFPMSIHNMDMAYIDMVRDFLGEKKRVWGQEIVMQTTEKILKALA